MKYLIFVLLFCFSCSEDKHEKPFIIINKRTLLNSETLLLYIYEDKNGYEISFIDNASKYQIGDTIK